MPAHLTLTDCRTGAKPSTSNRYLWVFLLHLSSCGFHSVCVSAEAFCAGGTHFLHSRWQRTPASRSEGENMTPLFSWTGPLLSLILLLLSLPLCREAVLGHHLRARGIYQLIFQPPTPTPRPALRRASTGLSHGESGVRPASVSQSDTAETHSRTRGRRSDPHSFFICILHK